MRLFIVAVALLIAASAAAQTPDQEPIEGQHGAAYVSYGYTSGSSLSLDNLQFDVDLRVPGTVVSFHRTLHRPDWRACRTERRIPDRTHHRVRSSPLPRWLGLRGGCGHREQDWRRDRDSLFRRVRSYVSSIHNHQQGGDGVDELTIGVGARF